MGTKKKIFGWYITGGEWLPVQVDDGGRIVAGPPAAHHLTHENGESDEISVLGLSGLLADSQTPLAHATNHNVSGSDVVDYIPSDGWKPATGTFTYASATTITVPSGAASIYQKGDKIKLTQTTVKYFYIVGVADTLLTITGGTDYTLANAAITLPYYSHIENPLGFPQWFNITAPVFDVATYDNGSGGQPTTISSKFKISGNLCSIYYLGSGVKAGAGVYFTISTFPFPTPVILSYRSTIGHAYTYYQPGDINYYGYLAVLSSVCYLVFITSIGDNYALLNTAFEASYEI